MKYNLKEYLLEIAFVLLLLRFLIIGTSISDALVLITLIISIVYTKNYLHKKNSDLNQDLKDKLEELNKRVDSVAIKAGLGKR